MLDLVSLSSISRLVLVLVLGLLVPLVLVVGLFSSSSRLVLLLVVGLVSSS